jgi:hypothetical protein
VTLIWLFSDILKRWRTRVLIILDVRLLNSQTKTIVFDCSQDVVLLEAPFDPVRRQMNSVLLTVDLTKAVADEAIERSDSIVVAYRKPKSVCSVNPLT